MTSNNNENFPRGGKRTLPIDDKIKRKHEDTLFGSEHQPKAKKSKKAKETKSKIVKTDHVWHASLKFRGTLSYNKIQDGMVILSCVRHISNLALQVEFPGLTFGLVTINRISASFTAMLMKKLQDEGVEESLVALKNVFKIGQLVPAKVISVENTDKGHEVQASVNPEDINADKMHGSFKKGMLVWASVISELDHGFELSVGVKNCRVFLPFKNTDNLKKYSVGELVYCVIHKAENSTIATTLTVSAKQEHIDKVQVTDDLNLQDLLPGTKVEFVVEEVSKHGIKGQFCENCWGYIDETQIFSKINLDKLNEGSIISAYVLFVEPITKITYLTLRNLENLPAPQHELGKIITSEVLANLSRGVHVKFGKKSTGFVTNKRLLNTLPKNAELDLVNAVRKKYPIGSKHSCRILDYNHMQELYICTFEQKIVKEKVFTIKDLKLGQIVSVKIEKIIPNGLVVKAGHVQGFVPNLHLSNSNYSNNIKSKYSVGMTVNARVLNMTEENVIFTLKQGLIETENCLTNFEDATPNSQHVGFVAQTKISGAMIGFFGGVKGWIGNKILNWGNSGGYVDPRDYFFVGQVVSVWVLGIRNEKLQLSVHFPSNIKKKRIKIGQKLSGKVTAAHSTGVKVEVGQHKVEGSIPVAHLGSHPSLCPILLKTYQPGDEIPNLLCIKNTDIPVMSIRESIAYQENSTKLPKLHDLKKDMTLRCSFEKNTDTGIYVSTPILDYHENIHVLKKNLPADESFEKQQNILAKVLNVDYKTRNIVLGVKRNNSDTSISDATNSLIHTLDDLDHITQFGQKNNWKLTQYKIGERVQCEVQKIDSDGNCVVTLPNEVKGLIAPNLYSRVTVGSAIEGVVIDYNFNEDYVAICCRNDIKQKINKIQNGIIKKSLQSSCVSEILLLTKFYALGVLKDSQCNRQLTYLPLLFTEDDPNKCIYEAGVKMKVILHRQVTNRIISLPKKFAPTLEKREIVKLKKERKEKKIKAIKTDIVEESESMEIDEDSDEKQEEDSSDSDVETDKHNNAKNVKQFDEVQNRGAVLSGIKSFFAQEGSDDNGQVMSSSDEETEAKEENRRKKKLTPKERADLAKKEEERISKIEKELADSTATPQSAEQFDRLLLANPNSSELWLKYMAMHVATTELDKARAVGRRAIETIDMALVKEKFNVWVALLNLENMYGTKESFEKLFEDAAKYNDSLEIYLNVIKLLASSGKLNEMEEKIKKVRSKEKQNSKMWLELGQVYYSLGKFREARNIKEAALKSILEKKRQFDLIVRFGIMEFQLGDLEQAIANFETILDTYPAKINIWFIYVDQLVKKKKIEAARKVLERAIGQKFPVKSMKAIFQKFISFEEQHGTSEAVREVKRKAKEYVDAIGAR